MSRVTVNLKDFFELFEISPNATTISKEILESVKEQKIIIEDIDFFSYGGIEKLKPETIELIIIDTFKQRQNQKIKTKPKPKRKNPKAAEEDSSEIIEVDNFSKRIRENSKADLYIDLTERKSSRPWSDFWHNSENLNKFEKYGNFEIVERGGDGDCMFYSILHPAIKIYNNNFTMNEIRKMCAQTITFVNIYILVIELLLENKPVWKSTLDDMQKLDSSKKIRRHQLIKIFDKNIQKTGNLFWGTDLILDFLVGKYQPIFFNINRFQFYNAQFISLLEPNVHIHNDHRAYPLIQILLKNDNSTHWREVFYNKKNPMVTQDIHGINQNLNKVEKLINSMVKCINIILNNGSSEKLKKIFQWQIKQLEKKDNKSDDKYIGYVNTFIGLLIGPWVQEKCKGEDYQQFFLEKIHKISFITFKSKIKSEDKKYQIENMFEPIIKQHLETLIQSLINKPLEQNFFQILINEISSRIISFFQNLECETKKYRTTLNLNNFKELYQNIQDERASEKEFIKTNQKLQTNKQYKQYQQLLQKFRKDQTPNITNLKNFQKFLKNSFEQVNQFNLKDFEKKLLRVK